MKCIIIPAISSSYCWLCLFNLSLSAGLSLLSFHTAMGLLAIDIANLLRNEEIPISDACRICLIIFFILLIMALFAYVFFGVYFLCIDYHVCLNDGLAAPLWWYCLIVLIFFCLSVTLGAKQLITVTTEELESEVNKRANKTDMFWRLFNMIIFQALIVIWGYIVMFSKGITCDHLKKTGRMHRQFTLFFLLRFTFS